MSRHGYRGDGAFGQFMVILPEHDTVVAMFSCTDEMQSVLDAMWEHLLPALGDDAARGVPSSADEALAGRMARLSLPPVAERRGGRPLGEVPAMTFRRQPIEASHPTVTSIDTLVGAGGPRMIIREGDVAIDVPLGDGWSIVDDTIAVSATRLTDRTIAVDLSFLATPHRLEIELDPATGTFVARWPLMPLFGVGPDHRLTALRAPAD
jgi:hypothetical protein